MTTDMPTRSPNPRFRFGDDVRIVAGFYRGSTGIVIAYADSGPSYMVRIRYPWSLLQAERIFIRDADLEAI